MTRSRRPPSLTRRDVVRLALLAPFAGVGRRLVAGEGRLPRALDLAILKKAPGRAVPEGEAIHVQGVRLHREWSGSSCRSRLVNTGRHAVALKEVVLFDVAHDLPAETGLYGEGFQMLSQTGGSVGQPLDLGGYTDAEHYKLPRPNGGRVLYGLMTLTPPGGTHAVLAFTSSRRFSGQFALHAGSIQVVVDTEGLELRPGAEWELEDLTFLSGPNREPLLEEVARRLAQSHPPLRYPSPPTGWCSWYCFGPKVTAEQVLANLDVIAGRVPGLKYVQVDDGYQPAMGDWLETGPAFGGDVRGVLKAIRDRGFEPAIWVAPFIAEAGSNLFREHPEWFVRDDKGDPLRSDRVTFSGWRRAPWYALDGTHPGVQQHLESVFRTMRQEWGCTYFKLDATFWGAMHGGRFHDPRATRVEAYRRGMEAVRRGTGDAFVLGCNHPIWASLGLIHGSRSSNDIKRTWKRVKSTARENLMRNWQNGRLWWNDPDALVLVGDLPEEEFRFHATVVYASGGLLLSGDDLTGIGPDRLEMLRALQPPTGVAGRFTDDSLTVGTVDLAGRHVVCLLNWDDTPRTLSHPLSGPHTTVDLWTGEVRKGRSEVSVTLPERSGRVLVCTPEGRARVAFDVAAFDRRRVLAAADRFLDETPTTITASSSPRSAGGPHDFFSEADYWWPDPANPGGPYVQRDGMSNPDNFVQHRRHLMRLSVQVPALAAAWSLTKDPQYAIHAGRHLRAWFVDASTRMAPHLRYAQAIQGRVTGRGIGIIDTLHLVEVARAILALRGSPALSRDEGEGVKAWFAEYLRWMTTHPYGIEEREAKNNHGTCWVAQVAAYAAITEDAEAQAYCRHRFKAVIVPGQVAPDGSFPQELRRTKPYGYSLFNLDAMATVCQLLSTPADDLWAFATADGRGMRKAAAYMFPYIRDKKRWPLPADVMFDREWPMRQGSLLFAGVAYGERDYVDLWKTLPADSDVEEVVRNFFIRQPVLWV